MAKEGPLDFVKGGGELEDVKVPTRYLSKMGGISSGRVGS
jgi:hypothetical protein